MNDNDELILRQTMAMERLSDALEKLIPLIEQAIAESRLNTTQLELALRGEPRESRT